MRTRPSVRFVGIAAVAALLSAVTASPAAHATTPSVLLVGTYNGIAGQYSSIQAAVNAAQPGDWILVGPGDYKEWGSTDPSASAGVWITTPDIHLRGMNRNSVIVDGSALKAKPCASGAKNQILGPKNADGNPVGANGIEVWKASGVSVENLTVCNYLKTQYGDNGNEIWWNGGDGSGTIGMGGFHGDYITATSTYSNGVDEPFGDYGIFVSNADGPGLIDHSYASNMGDASYYIGACPDCNATLNHAHAQDSALGYSGTNSGGHLIIENSEFDHNKTGITTDSENNDDFPSPQDGHCPDGETGPTGTASCEVWRNNYIHDNNNPNVPGAGSGLAGAAPVGTGIVVAGGEYDTILSNRIVHNGAWGVVITDVPYQGPPPAGATCQGGIPLAPDDSACYYESFGNETAGNAFKSNGFFGNATNGDIALAAIPHDPGNCFHDNTDPNGVTSDPPNIQDPPYNPCGQPNAGDEGVLVAELLCATQLVAPCPNLPEASYPRPSGTVKLSMPPPQATMPNPCTGVPTNPWCPTTTAVRRGATGPATGPLQAAPQRRTTLV